MCSEQAKSSRSSRDKPNKRSSTLATISLKDLMDKEVLSSSQDGNIRDLLVLSDPYNKKSTKIKQRICILDHPNQALLDSKSSPKSLNDILGMVKNANSLLDLCALLVVRIG